MEELVKQGEQKQDGFNLMARKNLERPDPTCFLDYNLYKLNGIFNEVDPTLARLNIF